MHPNDILREIAKIQDALAHAITHHEKTNEANAALHLSDRVLYSPLTTELVAAKEAADRLEDNFAAAP